MEIGGVDWALNSWIGSTETESIIVIVIIIVVVIMSLFPLLLFVIFYTNVLENI